MQLLVHRYDGKSKHDMLTVTSFSPASGSEDSRVMISGVRSWRGFTYPTKTQPSESLPSLDCNGSPSPTSLLLTKSWRSPDRDISLWELLKLLTSLLLAWSTGSTTCRQTERSHFTLTREVWIFQLYAFLKQKLLQVATETYKLNTMVTQLESLFHIQFLGSNLKGFHDFFHFQRHHPAPFWKC